jgi:predicted CopG family antitoxin
MKTITIDETAYQRLKAWKRGPKDSFTQVVKRVVPLPGTLAAFAGYAETHQTDRLPGNETMEKAIEQRSAAKKDPWT